MNAMNAGPASSPLDQKAGENDAAYAARLVEELNKRRAIFWGVLTGLIVLFLIVLTGVMIQSRERLDRADALSGKVNQLTNEIDQLKNRKPELVGITAEQCLAKAQAMVKEAVNNQCEGKIVATPGPIRYRDRPVAPVARPAAYVPAERVPVPALPAASAPAPVASAPAAVVPEGGCIVSSDGTAILASDTSNAKQAKGTELGRIHNRNLVVKYPDSLSSTDAHDRACQAWRTEFARISLKEGRVNDDGHTIK